MARFIALLLLSIQGPPSSQVFAQAVSANAKFGPQQWPALELDRYLALEDGPQLPQPPAITRKAMVAGTSSPLAVHAGLEALKHGGNAADAVLTTALTQVALSAGATVSYAGIMTVTYYDARSRKVYALNAGYNTVQNENSALTIPPMGDHSGRTALVPGFMAGAQALHNRFGKLPFSTLFSPAIWVAEKGVPINSAMGNWLVSQQPTLARLPETKRIFTKENGEFYERGNLFWQPQLARTLQRIAGEGSAYMYTGEWARHFVDAVQREGGKITLEDLASYRPVWSEPLRISYRGHEVVTLGTPSRGGLHTLASLKLAETANLKKYGPYTRSPDALYDLIQIARAAGALALLPRQRLKAYFPDVDPTPASLLTSTTATRIWTRIQQPDWNEKRLALVTETVALFTGKGEPNHSAGVVAVDKEGNVAALLHSCNCFLWGSTGIFVDGISVPDSASLQQPFVASVGPGVRLPETTNPLIVLKGGKPSLASTAIGFALQETTLQNLINILDFGMNPETSVKEPNFQGAFWGMNLTGPPQPELEKEVVDPGFPEPVLEGVRKRGQALYRGFAGGYQTGYWIAIQIEPKRHKLKSGATRTLNAFVEGY